MRWAGPAVAVCMSLSLGVVASCRDATQVEAALRTSVPSDRSHSVAFWASHSGRLSTPSLESGAPWQDDGRIGTVAVVPHADDRGPALVLRAAMGLRGRSAASCTDDADLTGCIIARRTLRFEPHTRLRVPVTLYLSCEGVRCSDDSTCNALGKCVSAAVDPLACASPAGCLIEGDTAEGPGVVRDAGVVGDANTPLADAAPSDTGTDAGADVAPAPIVPSRIYVSLSSFGGHACVLLSNGTAKCWGQNGSGQLGLVDSVPRGVAPGQMGAALPVVDLGSASPIVELGLGDSHTCARLTDGTIKCWGQNLGGELGLGDTLSRGGVAASMGANLPAVLLPGKATALTVGGSHACARL
jgi:hypothetical protein